MYVKMCVVFEPTLSAQIGIWPPQPNRAKQPSNGIHIGVSATSGDEAQRGAFEKRKTAISRLNVSELVWLNDIGQQKEETKITTKPALDCGATKSWLLKEIEK